VSTGADVGGRCFPGRGQRREARRSGPRG